MSTGFCSGIVDETMGIVRRQKKLRHHVLLTISWVAVGYEMESSEGLFYSATSVELHYQIQVR